MDIKTKLGIVEGFYGRPYENGHRRYLIERAAAMGYGFYIYAPKNDGLLRRRWRDPISTDEAGMLKDLALWCRTHGMQLSFGISPLGINHAEAGDQEILISKTLRLQELTAAPFVCVFFDDIKAECACLGAQQGQLLSALRLKLPAKTALVCCPTFYSFDPVLERIFGRRPQDYFADLAATMPDDTILCWTGNHVISERITSEDLSQAQALLKRPLCLWDNYPVNDGKKLSDRIFLSPFKGRTGLDGSCLMHAVNPMTEAALSAAALSSLPLIYANAGGGMIEKARLGELRMLFGEHTEEILEDLELCELEGRQALPAERRARLIELCASMKTGAPGVCELRGYLKGEYAFDPQCLTS